MSNSISKTTIALAMVLTMLAVMFAAAPATAGGFRMGGFGGGFHPGFAGFHPGFRPGFRPGFVAFHGSRFFHPGFFRNGVFINGWWGPTIVAGSAWGAGCWSYRPIYDSWGSYLGEAYVNICS